MPRRYSSTELWSYFIKSITKYVEDYFKSGTFIYESGFNLSINHLTFLKFLETFLEWRFTSWIDSEIYPFPGRQYGTLEIIRCRAVKQVLQLTFPLSRDTGTWRSFPRLPHPLKSRSGKCSRNRRRYADRFLRKSGWSCQDPELLRRRFPVPKKPLPARPAGHRWKNTSPTPRCSYRSSSVAPFHKTGCARPGNGFQGKNAKGLDRPADGLFRCGWR